MALPVLQFKNVSGLLLSAMAFSLLMIPLIQACSFKYCDQKGDYPITISNVVAFPDPIETGDPAFILIPANNTDGNISNGTLQIDLWYFNAVSIYSETLDLCTTTYPGCPVETGFFVLNYVQHFPFYAPPGAYTVEMKILKEDGFLLSCFVFDLFTWPTVARGADSRICADKDLLITQS